MDHDQQPETCSKRNLCDLLTHSYDSNQWDLPCNLTVVIQTSVAQVKYNGLTIICSLDLYIPLQMPSQER